MVFAETPIWLENNWRKVNQQIAQRHLTAMAYSETRSNERRRHGNKIHAMIIESYPTKTHPCELVSNYIHHIPIYIDQLLSYIYSHIIKTICQHQQQLSLLIIYFIITPFLCQTWHPSPPWPHGHPQPHQPPPLDNPGPRSVEGGMEVILKMHVTGTPHGWTNEVPRKVDGTCSYLVLVYI